MVVKIKCPKCNGTGIVRYTGFGAFGETESYKENCQTCNGSGELTGKLVEDEIIELPIGTRYELAKGNMKGCTYIWTGSTLDAENLKVGVNVLQEPEKTKIVKEWLVCNSNDDVYMADYLLTDEEANMQFNKYKWYRPTGREFSIEE